MTTLLDQCRIEAMNTVANAISMVIAEAKRMHGANDPELSRYLVTALIDALLEETEDKPELRDRCVEVLCFLSGE